MKALRLVTALAVGGAMAAWMASPLPAAQQPGNDKSSTDTSRPADHDRVKSSSQQQESPSFLGVVVSPVHPRLAAHFSEILGKDRGLEVEGVAPDSPAAKAGVKPYDFLISFADQKLSSPEQLLKLVHSEKAGSKVPLTLLHNGKTEKIEVTVEQMKEESRPLARDEATPQGPHGRLHHRMFPRGFAGTRGGQGNADWERFDSMSLEKTGKDSFKISIRYLNDKGKIEEHQFKGTRDQLAKDIQSEKDLTHSERSHLLGALNVSNNSMNFPGVRFVPGQGLIIDLDQFAPDQSHQSEDSDQF
jgi:serine protease Do